MVSVRRRKLIGLTGRSSSSPVANASNSDIDVPEKSEQTGKPINVRRIPSVAPNQAVEGKKEKDTIVNRPAKKQKLLVEIGIPPAKKQNLLDVAKPPVKKQKLHAEVDPENPMEVHTYLMKLKEDNKLESGPMRRNGEMPVKEWMEKCYPHIFRVFPQNPRVLFQFADKSMQNEFLYCHYWLFLFELRNIVLMDHCTSPDYVTSLVKVIENLEKQGFDCRFMRSELIVIGTMIKQQHEITLAVRNMIASRTLNLEKELQAAAVEIKKESESDEEGKPQSEDQPKQPNNLLNGHHNRAVVVPKTSSSAALERDYIEEILERHKKMLAAKEEEGKRLEQVLEKINELHHQHTVAVFSRR